MEASEAPTDRVAEKHQALRRVIDGFERRADEHQQRALEHGAEGRVDLARQELELARCQRGEALVRRAMLDDWERPSSGDGSDRERARQWHVELRHDRDDQDQLAGRLTRQLHGWDLAVIVSDAAIAVAELIAAADRHGRARVVGLVSRADSLTVEVHNDGAVMAPGRPRHDVVGAATSATLGALAADWGWRPTGSGICLWCQLTTSA